MKAAKAGSKASGRGKHIPITELVATSIRLTDEASNMVPRGRKYFRLVHEESRLFERIVHDKAHTLSDLESRLGLAVRIMEIAEEGGPVLDLIKAALRDTADLAWKSYL